jgi:phosphoenolpyruvate carboxykinase (ATP)
MPQAAIVDFRDKGRRDEAPPCRVPCIVARQYRRLPESMPVSMSAIDLSGYGIHVKRVLRNPAPAALYEEANKGEAGTAIVSSGALAAFSGENTGRSPEDKRIVENPESVDDIWWGPINMKLSEHVFDINRERVLDYFNTREQLYVIDAFAGADPDRRLKVRVVCERAYHALFMWNMLVRPSDEQLESFGDPDVLLLNAGTFPAAHHLSGVSSKKSVDLFFENGEMLVLGTQYAGEMKKGIFTVMNYLMPTLAEL